MILVRAAAPDGAAEEGADTAPMAIVLKINPGFDAAYPWREIGTGAQPASPLDYYLAPADKGGEPAGRWAGRGLATLGFTAGQVIDRAVFEPLYGQHLDPRDPVGKSRLGRAAQQFTPEEAIFTELAAAEPHASPARLAELRTLAKAQVRHAVPFWDITVSVSKSITLFYGGLLAAAEQAARAGDTARAGHLEREAGRVWAAIMEGNAAALEYLQDEAGMTRTGYHRGSGTESRAELGKWGHARNWVIGSFRQHTSRDGDPQLHVHNLVLNKVVTERDGRWRKLDSRSLYRFQGAAAAIAAAVTETALTRDFGVAWVPRADGHGREIAGISQVLMDAFSSRRQTITPEARKVAAEREAQTGRRPDARQMYRIQKDIAYRTRARKPEAPLDIRAKLAEWEQTARYKDVGELAAIPDAVAEAARQASGNASGQGVPAEAALRVARMIGQEFARLHGRSPDAAEFRRIKRFARFITLNGADTRPVEPEPYRLELAGGWEETARLWDRLGCRYDAALALHDAGHEPALRAALRIFTDLGAPAAARITRQKMRQMGIRSIPVGPRTATRSDPLGLTRREHEVLDLVRAGHTNAEIAAKLFISPKTVDHHLSALLAKLDAPPGTSPWPTPPGSTGPTPQKNRRTQQENRGIAPDALRSRPPYGRLELIVSRGGRHEPRRRIAAVPAADEQEPDDPHAPLHDRRSRGDRRLAHRRAGQHRLGCASR